MSIEYGDQKLYEAVLECAIGEGTPQERLAKAYSEQLVLLERKNFPTDKAWNEFQEVRKALTRKPSQAGEGSALASASEMSTQEAQRWLHKIVELHEEIDDACGGDEGEKA